MNVKQIAALVLDVGPTAVSIPELRHFGVAIASHSYQSVVRDGILPDDPCDVVVLPTNGDFAATVTCLTALQRAQQNTAIRDAGVCLYLDRPDVSAVEWLGSGADSIAFRDQPPGLIALAFFTAYHAGVLRRVLTGRVRELEDKLEQTHVIDQAKALIAKQLNVSELDALSRLRKEARNRRRPMIELARVVIEADRIVVGGGPPGLNAAEATRDETPLPPMFPADEETA